MNPVEPSNPSTPREPFADDPARFLEWAARAVGHDLSNQVLAIQWCGTLLDDAGCEPSEVRELAREISCAVGRAHGSLAFLSTLIDRAPRPIEVRELIEHSSSLIRQALGSSVGVELDAERCERRLLGVDARGFVEVLTMLAVRLAKGGPGGVLRIEAQTRPVAADDSEPPRLMVSLRSPTGADDGPEDRMGAVEPCPGALADPGLAPIAAYLEHRLNGRMVWEVSGRSPACELRVVVATAEMTPPAPAETARRARSVA